MSELTDSEKYLLRELRYKPEWSSLLEKLKLSPPKPYRPSGNDTDDHKFHNWVYDSGRYHANREILSVLQGVKDE